MSLSSFESSKDEVLNSLTLDLPDNLMLGKQAEYYFENYLRHSLRYKLLAANIQVQGRHQTIGELDYLVFDRVNQRTLHIELACKFYLYDPKLEDSHIAKWIGPNRKDTLNEKLGKLTAKQFPLLYKEETKSSIQELKIEIETVKQQLCLKAFLFIPKNYSQKSIDANFVDCVVGYWVTFSEFLSEDKEILYAIPKKKQWLLPAEKIEEWVLFSEAKTIIEENLNAKKAPLVYKKVKGTIVKFFIVWW